jgi:hypothetical protein
MGLVGNVMNAAGAALYAFRESMLNADPQGRKASLDYGVWDRWEARLTRYDLLWSIYQNNSYQDLVHPWAARYKTAYGLYKHSRHIYNPAYRLGEFWASHLQGGLLDKLAGDGETAPSALPIITDNEAIRAPIARLWKDSRWQRHKDIFTRWGSVLGDVAVKVCDDTERGKVRLQVVHPGHLKWVDFDDQHNVKAYIIQKWMYDPRDASIANESPTIDPRARQRVVIYQEKCFRDGDDVVYQTFLDGTPYAWYGDKPEYVEKYGFVPLVIASHESIGLDYGACAFHSGLSRFREVDDMASGLSDQIRKAIRAPMLMAGVKAPSGGLIKSAQTDRAQQTPDAVANNPEPARTESDYLYATDSQARAQHLTYDLDLTGVIAHIDAMLADIERNFPELIADTGNMSGTVTAEAIRNARQQASGKVQGRRPGYDEPTVALHQMALTIGGMKGYDGYEGFNDGSFHAGKLDHAIGQRAVFEVDPRDSIEEDQAFWTAIQTQVTVGVPLALALERNGWSEEDLEALADARAKEPAPEDGGGNGTAGGNDDTNTRGAAR